MFTTANHTLLRGSLAVLALGLALGATGCGKADTAASPSASAPAPASASASSSASGATSAPASATPSPSATPTRKPTMVHDLSGITVAPTTFGKAPKVTAKWPLQIDRTQVKVLQQGNGAVVEKGGFVHVNYQGVDARTGKVFDSSWQNGSPADFSLSGVVPGFTKAIQGQKVGSRVVVMMTAADGYPQGNPQVGIEAGDNLVFVVDILGKSVPVAPKPGLPTVKDDAKGVPSVTVPKGAAPKQLVVQQLVKGPGAKVGANDQVAVNYRSYNWADGKLLQDDYATGTEVAQLNQLIPAWQKALVGQPVGSRVLVIAPPSTAFGAQGTSSIPKNATLVFVIDIRAAKAAA